MTHDQDRIPPDTDSFVDRHPLEFRLADDLGHPTVCIVDNSSHGRHLNLIIRNVSHRAIEFPAADNRALEVLFRPGTFDLQDAVRFAPVDADWTLSSVLNDDQTLSLFIGRSRGFVLPPQGLLTIVIANVQAALPGGARPTQVQLGYQRLRYVNGEVFSGYRLTFLEIVNQRGRTEAPFVSGFIGSNTVLNDGKTRNTLTVFLGNPSLQPLSLAPGELQVRPKLLISFDSGQLQEADEPWALGHADEVAGIDISTEAPDWVIHRHEQGQAPVWVLVPPENAIDPNTWINFTLFPIVTRSPAGFANLTLTWQNVSGFRDGQVQLPIEKGHRLYRQQPVPRPSDSPAVSIPRQTVHAFSGGMVIGGGYAADRIDDEPTAPAYPADGDLLVQGNVGIGIDSPSAKLDVAGSTRLNGVLHVTGESRLDGKVGIGTNDAKPKGQLHVTGDYYGKGHVFLHAYEGDGSSGTAYVQARDTSNSSSLALQLRTQNKGKIVEAFRLREDGNAKFSGTIEDKNGLVVPTGTIVMWSNFKGLGIPLGWALCDGENGTPDLRGRFVVGHAPGGAPNRQSSNVRNDDCSSIGRVGGAKTHQLSQGEMPSHNHAGNPTYTRLLAQNKNIGSKNDTFGDNWGHNFPERPNLVWTSSLVARGGDEPHENRPPYYVLAFIMKLP